MKLMKDIPLWRLKQFLLICEAPHKDLMDSAWFELTRVLRAECAARLQDRYNFLPIKEGSCQKKHRLYQANWKTVANKVSDVLDHGALDAFLPETWEIQDFDLEKDLVMGFFCHPEGNEFPGFRFTFSYCWDTGWAFRWDYRPDEPSGYVDPPELDVFFPDTELQVLKQLAPAYQGLVHGVIDSMEVQLRPQLTYIDIMPYTQLVLHDGKVLGRYIMDGDECYRFRPPQTADNTYLMQPMTFTSRELLEAYILEQCFHWGDS